jgi:hypothetical protein
VQVFVGLVSILSIILLSCKTDMSMLVARIGFILLFPFHGETPLYYLKSPKKFPPHITTRWFSYRCVLTDGTILPRAPLAIQCDDQAVCNDQPEGRGSSWRSHCIALSLTQTIHRNHSICCVESADSYQSRSHE